MALSPFSVDVYLPSLQQIATELATDLQLVESTVSSYLFGLMPGLLLGAPISDRFGRRRTIIGGLTLYAIASALIVVTRTIDQLLVLRIVQAIGAGAGAVNVGAIVRDFYTERESARVFSLIAMIALGAPLIGPSIGTVVLQFFEWRVIFAGLTLYAGLLILGTMLLLPEPSRATSEQAGRPGLFSEIADNVRRVFRVPHAFGFGLCAAFAHSAMLVFLSDASFAYMDYFGVSRPAFAGLFAANICAMMVFNRVNVRVLRRVGPRSILPVGLTMQLVAAVGLLAYVVLADPRLAVVAPLITLVIGPIGIITGNAMASYLSYFPQGAATANGIMGAFQYGFGALAGATLGVIHDGTLRTVAAGMLGCSLLAAVAFLSKVYRRG